MPDLPAVPTACWALPALGMATVFAVVWPSDAATGAGPAGHALLRWGHSAAWVLLAGAALARGAGAVPLATSCAIAAGLTYAGFLAALL